MAKAIGGPYVPHIFGDKATDLYNQHWGWITAEAASSIAWPVEDTVVRYDGDDYFLRGTGKDHSQQPCLTMRTSTTQTGAQALHKMYKFGSILGWYLGGYVDLGGHITSSHPVRYGRMGAAMGGPVMGDWQKFDCNYMPIIPSDEARKALAFWREGQRLYRVHDAYSFLSFYKVIDSQFTKARGRDKGAWIRAAIPRLKGHAAERAAELQALGLDVADHILGSGRHAVAHASIGEVIVDPDLVEDRNRIRKDIDVMQGLARLYIEEELEIPDHRKMYRERDRLIPLYKYIPAEILERAKSSDAAPRRALRLDGMKVNVSVWPDEALPGLKNLTLKVTGVRGGVARLTASNLDDSVKLVFYFDFNNGEAHTGLEEGFAAPGKDGNVDGVVAALEYFCDVIGNKTAEIQLADGEKVQCKVVIPVNILPGPTIEGIKLKIAELKGMKAID